MAENPILIDEDSDKQNTPAPDPATSVSGRPIQPPVVINSQPLKTRNENVPEDVY